MSEREHFLQRWSRRKREAGSAPDATEAAPAKLESKPTAPIESADLPPSKGAPTIDTPKPEEGFDLAKLPSIDSITAATDIRAFLMPGVPEELKRAALRRAWQADPAIRDFVGLSENSWDFNNPEGLHGFGPLEMTEELKKIIERTLAPRGQPPDAPSETSGTGTPASPASASHAETKDEETGANTSADASIPKEAKEKNLPAASGLDARPQHVAARREATIDEENRRRPKVGRGGALPK